MFVLIFALPFAAALLCLGLNRLVATRWLGIGAAVALLLAAVLLLLAAPPLALPGAVWALFGEQPVRLALVFDAASRPFGLLALGGGALALLALALALPSDLRGFGGLFAALLLMLLATTAGLANQEPLLLPFAWALVVLLAFVALRASGASAGVETLPVGLLAGLAGVLLLTAAALLLQTRDARSATDALVCWTLVGMLVFGAPAFHAVFGTPADAPAALGGALLPLGLPLLGGYALIRSVAALTVELPPIFRTVWALLGLLALLSCAAGAASSTRLRQIVGWQFSAQLGLVLLAMAQTGDLLPHAGALALLMNAALTTLAGYLAVAVLERRAGTDDLAEIGAHGPLPLPGLALVFAAASAIGIPGTWGWWVQGALIDGMRSTMPWLIPVLLAGAALRALAYIAPLAVFWRVADTPAPRRGWPALVVQLCPLLAALPLLIWGVVPQLAWNGWQAGMLGVFVANAPAPALPTPMLQIAVGLAALALVALPLLAWRGRQRCPPIDREIRNAALLTPQALGYSLRGLAWLADPAGLFQLVWSGLLRLSQLVAWLLALIEQRYYLAGLMIAVIIVIMLMI